MTLQIITKVSMTKIASKRPTRLLRQLRTDTVRSVRRIAHVDTLLDDLTAVGQATSPNDSDFVTGLLPGLTKIDAPGGVTLVDRFENVANKNHRDPLFSFSPSG